MFVFRAFPSLRVSVVCLLLAALAAQFPDCTVHAQASNLAKKLPSADLVLIAAEARAQDAQRIRENQKPSAEALERYSTLLTPAAFKMSPAMAATHNV